MRTRQFKQKDQFMILLAGGVIVLAVFILSNKSILKKEYITKRSSNQGVAAESPTPVNGRALYNDKTRTIESPDITRPIDKVKYKFILTVPIGWKIQMLEGNTGYVSLELVKEKHILDISAPVAGSSTCVYKDEQISPPHFEIMDMYYELSTSFGTTRVSKAASEDNQTDILIFRGCQNTIIPRWNTYTKIGYINYRVPNNYNEKIIEEMNTILQNIEYFEL